MRKLVLFVATGAGSGYSPLASGAVGSVVGLALWLPLVRLPALAYAAAALIVFGTGVWAAQRAEVLFDRKDDGRITIDEVAGMLLSLAFLPARADVAVVGFLLFRLFDVWKPQPARAAEGLGGGLGVMADDAVAAVYANLVGQLLWRVLLPEGLL